MRAVEEVGEVADRAGVGTRRLQRLFATYVGVSPKVDLGFLARELGYFDQAHFARDFRAAVGRPPAAYARGAAGPG